MVPASFSPYESPFDALIGIAFCNVPSNDTRYGFPVSRASFNALSTSNCPVVADGPSANVNDRSLGTSTASCTDVQYMP
ncbi:hypothetical protein [Kribbella solani]|nr:hypothetical protein [Kribbella solani]